jgi:uncharacterized protein YndB with AHSA1/START domain/DNA-binding transcriptional ArsR family regulator
MICSQMAAYLDTVFKALADPSRRRLLDSLNDRNGQTLGELCGELDMARQSVSKHLDVLEAANLVTTVRRGREKLHYLNAAPIGELAERWIGNYERPRVRALARLKYGLEEAQMEKPSFVYTTYIRTTPEALWRALTEPDFTEQYWGTRLESDWQVGSTVSWVHNGVAVEDAGQVVLEADPPHRLAYTWHTFTPAWADAWGMSEEYRAKGAAEPRSRVAFSIEAVDGLVKLTVVHDGFEQGSVVLESVSSGWPKVISGLKTMLETGTAVAA